MSKFSYPVIIRIKKLSSWRAVGTSGSHTWRTMKVPHADESRTHLNEDWRPVTDPQQLRVALEARLALAEKRASRPVLSIEYLITARREAFRESGGTVEWRQYFSDALAWLERRHTRENVVAVNIQLDEQTPHMVAYVCPLVAKGIGVRRRWIKSFSDTGTKVPELRKYPVPAHIALSAAHYIGSREKLSRIQTEFAAEVGSRHGLRRGIERSALRHIQFKAYHSALARALQQRLIIDPVLLKRQGRILARETPEQMAVRLAEALQEQVEGLIARAATAELDQQRAREWQETAARAQADRWCEQEEHRATRKALTEISGGLTSEEIAEMKKLRHMWLRQREEQRQQKRLQQQVEQQREEAARVDKLKTMAPQDLAKLPAGERRALWELLICRADLSEDLDRMSDSGLFHLNGEPRDIPETKPKIVSPKPRLQNEGEDPTNDQSPSM